MGLSWGVASFAPFVWSWNVLLGFFIWSVAYGILLLLQKSRQGAKSIYLVVSVFGLIGLIVLGSHNGSVRHGDDFLPVLGITHQFHAISCDRQIFSMATKFSWIHINQALKGCGVPYFLKISQMRRW